MDVVRRAPAGDEEPLGLEPAEEGGVVDLEEVLQDVGAGVAVEDDVVDVGPLARRGDRRGGLAADHRAGRLAEPGHGHRAERHGDEDQTERVEHPGPPLRVLHSAEDRPDRRRHGQGHRRADAPDRDPMLAGDPEVARGREERVEALATPLIGEKDRGDEGRRQRGPSDIPRDQPEGQPRRRRPGQGQGERGDQGPERRLVHVVRVERQDREGRDQERVEDRATSLRRGRRLRGPPIGAEAARSRWEKTHRSGPASKGRRKRKRRGLPRNARVTPSHGRRAPSPLGGSHLLSCNPGGGRRQGGRRASGQSARRASPRRKRRSTFWQAAANDDLRKKRR